MSDITQLERQLQILNRLANISTTLNSTMKLRPLLNVIIEAAAEITDAEAASVLLWDVKANELRFAAATKDSTPPEIFSKPVPLEGSIAGTILRENRLMQVDHVAGDPRHYARLDQQVTFQTRSLLGVPMNVRDRTIGVLEVVNKRTSPWTEHDCNYLPILAAQAAVAIEGAQLVGQLQKANDDLSQLDTLKNNFIAIASHELRTPLGVILGYASFLQATPDDEVAEVADKVVNSALRLRRIIEDLTNLRYLQTNEADLHRHPVALESLIDGVVKDIAEMAEARHQALRVAPASALIDVDLARMSMALSNVLNNAVSFTPDGGLITVESEIRPPYVYVSVTDNGIGLEKDQLNRIFTNFYQVEDHMTRHHGGLGIGLSIARGLVEAHGGRIWASSAGINQGARFTIAMPLAQA